MMPPAAGPPDGDDGADHSPRLQGVIWTGPVFQCSDMRTMHGHISIPGPACICIHVDLSDDVQLATSE